MPKTAENTKKLEKKEKNQLVKALVYEQFVNALMAHLPIYKAAEAAGYAGDMNTLAVAGNRLLKIDKVKELIAERIAQRARNSKYTQEEWELDTLALRLEARQAGHHSAAATFNHQLGQHILAYPPDKLQIEFPGLQPPDTQAAQRSQQRQQARQALTVQADTAKDEGGQAGPEGGLGEEAGNHIPE